VHITEIMKIFMTSVPSSP